MYNWGSSNIWYHLLGWSEERVLRNTEASSAIDRDIICIYHPNIRQHKPSHHLLLLASQSQKLWNKICRIVWMLSSQVINTVIVMILLLTTQSALSIRRKYSVSSNVIICKVFTWRESDLKICNLLIRNICGIVINWNFIKNNDNCLNPIYEVCYLNNLLQIFYWKQINQKSLKGKCSHRKLQSGLQFCGR